VDERLLKDKISIGPIISRDQANLIYYYKKTNPHAQNEKTHPLYGILLVPNLMKNNFNLLHSDDFIKERIEYSTFTP
jgi:hypothetical protein